MYLLLRLPRSLRQLSVSSFYLDRFLLLTRDQELAIYFSAVHCVLDVCPFPIVVVRMALIPHQCAGTAGKMCSHFLPAKDKDCHMFSINYLGKSCTADGCYEDCQDGTREK